MASLSNCVIKKALIAPKLGDGHFRRGMLKFSRPLAGPYAARITYVNIKASEAQVVSPWTWIIDNGHYSDCFLTSHFIGT